MKKANSAASWAGAGFVGFPQSPQNIRSKRLRRNEEGVNIKRGSVQYKSTVLEKTL